MKPSDIRVEDVQLTFSDERLAVPLRLSKGTISDVTYAKVVVDVRTGDGRHSRGTGAILLSDLWAFPAPRFSHTQKDAIMRRLCEALAEEVRADDQFADPMQKGVALENALDDLVRRVEKESEAIPPDTVPYLAALDCLSSFDAALHDAWGRAIGGPAYEHYTETWLNADLGTYLDGSFAGLYPQDFLGQRRRKLAVQHVIGVGDPLTPDQIDPQQVAPEGIPLDLTTWIQRQGVFCFKIKTKGNDPREDAQRIIDVHAVARDALQGTDAPIHLSIDPNEGCSHPDILIEMLDRLAAEAPAAYQALDYIEQPTPRDLDRYTFTLHEVAERKPVIIDESLERLETLERLSPQGWSGLAVKTCKGHTHSLLAYCWGKRNGMYVTLQDLTNPGLALVHSANLCSYLDLSVDYFEYNSRQYMPTARMEEKAIFPRYFQIQDGKVELGEDPPNGLY